MQKHSFAGLIAGLAAASIWGGMYVVSKVVLEVIPPFTLLTMRLVLGAISLGLVIILRKKYTLTRAQTLHSFLVGVVGYGVSLRFQFVGTKLSTASNGSLVTSVTPAFVLIFAPFLLAERTTPHRIFALLVSTLGVMAVIDPRNAELSPSLFWGNLSLLAAALTWALYSVLVRKVTRGAPARLQRMDAGRRDPVESIVRHLGDPYAGHGRDHVRGRRRDFIFGDHFHRHRHVPLELRLRGTARRSRFVNVLRPTCCWDDSRHVVP